MKIEIDILSNAEIKGIEEQYNLTLSWLETIDKYYITDTVPLMNYKISVQDNVIALLAASIESNQILHIDNFEVLNKRNGYGTKIIKELQNEFKEIHLYPANKSDTFWEKNHFFICDDGAGCPQFIYKQY